MTEKADIWMPLYVADIIADTMHLSTAEFGAYMLLICAYWRRKAPLQDDERTLSATVRVAVSEWGALRSSLAPFFQIEDGMWKHKRVEHELAEARRRYEARKRGAQTTNNAKRHAKRSDSDAQSDTLSDTLTGTQSQSHIDIESKEPLPSFPKSEDEAKAAVMFVGCPESFAVEVWHKAMGRGGCDAKDVPIRSWAHHLRTEWTYQQNREARQSEKIPNISDKGSIPLWRQIKSTEAVIVELEGQLKSIPAPFPFDEANPGHKVNREERARIRTEIAEMKGKLAELNRRAAEGSEQ
jgi:uncharacterized protein YdaU (DUF1376 family)